MSISHITNRSDWQHKGHESEMESRLLRVFRAASLLLTSLERQGNRTYTANPGDVLMLRSAVSAATPVIHREVGR